MDANEKEINSKQQLLWDFDYGNKTKRKQTLFFWDFRFLMNQRQIFVFFFVAFNRMNSKNTKTNAETKLESKDSFYGFSIYDKNKCKQDE